MNTWRLCLPLLLLPALAARAGDAWLAGLSAGTRARSMGGCFAAISTADDAQLYNPAGLAGLERRGRLVLVLDPLASLARARRSPGDWSWAEALPRAALARRLEWRGPHLALALAPAEWLPAASAALAIAGEEQRPATGDLVPTVTAALALDQRVRLGLSVGAWYAQHVRRRAGVSYGAIIRANRRMDVGGQAVYLPVGALDARRPLDQLGDGTVNVGVAWHPFGRAAEEPRRATLLLALDVRNVTQEPGLAARQELHLGGELHFPAGLDLRAGIAWPNLGGFSRGQPCPGGGLGWRARLLGGSLGVDLGWTRDPARAVGIWMGGLRWSP